MCVASEVVELVDVDAVALVRDDVVEERLGTAPFPLESCWRFTPVAQHQLFNEVHVCLVEAVLAELRHEVVLVEEARGHTLKGKLLWRATLQGFAEMGIDTKLWNDNSNTKQDHDTTNRMPLLLTAIKDHQLIL